ncbi:hypothetical protein BTA31_22235, partial [Bacillus haynesii]
PLFLLRPIKLLKHQRPLLRVFSAFGSRPTRATMTFFRLGCRYIPVAYKKRFIDFRKLILTKVLCKITPFYKMKSNYLDVKGERV